MRSEDLYLSDIYDACVAIEKFAAGTSREQFLQNDLIQSAVVQKFTVIGEAASKIGESIRAEHPEVDWQTLVSFRNFLVHVYFHTTMEKVWEAVAEARELGEHIATIIAHRKGSAN